MFTTYLTPLDHSLGDTRFFEMQGLCLLGMKLSLRGRPNIRLIDVKVNQDLQLLKQVNRCLY